MRISDWDMLSGRAPYSLEPKIPLKGDADQTCIQRAQMMALKKSRSVFLVQIYLTLRVNAVGTALFWRSSLHPLRTL